MIVAFKLVLMIPAFVTRSNICFVLWMLLTMSRFQKMVTVDLLSRNIYFFMFLDAVGLMIDFIPTLFLLLFIMFFHICSWFCCCWQIRSYCICLVCLRMTDFVLLIDHPFAFSLSLNLQFVICFSATVTQFSSYAKDKLMFSWLFSCFS